MSKTGKGDQVKSSIIETSVEEHIVTTMDDNKARMSIEQIYFDAEYKLSNFLIKEDDEVSMHLKTRDLFFKLYNCPDPQFKLFVNNFGNSNHTIVHFIHLHSKKYIKNFNHKYPHIDRILKLLLSML